MIVELFMLQLTLKGIMAEHDKVMRKKQAQRKIYLTKLRLAQLLEDYRNGKVNSKEYEKLEADILTSFNNIRNNSETKTKRGEPFSKSLRT